LAKPEVTPQQIVEIIQEVAHGTYVPEKYFRIGPAPQPILLHHPPPLHDGVEYTLLTLNAVTPVHKFVSVQAGGVAYEDPFWAILAAHAIAQHTRVALPLAEDNDELWKNVEITGSAILHGNYDPYRFFGAIEDFSSEPQFGLISVSTQLLRALRKSGMQALPIASLPLFFQLFESRSRHEMRSSPSQ
jgi:hypothetical protein